MTALWGMVGTGDFLSTERPKSWREGLLYVYPNGDAQLTGLTSKMPSKKLDDYEHGWHVKVFPDRYGTITGVWKNVALDSAYVSGGVAGDTLYVQCAEATAEHFREGHLAMLRSTVYACLDTLAIVTGTKQNGASSYIACKLLEADDNGSGVGKDLSDANQIDVAGSANAQGSEMPQDVLYVPVKLTQKTGIARNSLFLTRTAIQTRLRTKNAYIEAKRECLERHGTEIENMLLFSVQSETTGANGEPLTTPDGLRTITQTYAPDNCDQYDQNTEFSGLDWSVGGEDWLDYYLSLIFKYGRREKLAYCGIGALRGINKLVKSNGNFEFTPQTREYGIQVVKWTTTFGSIDLVTHPLFSHNPVTTNAMLVFEPATLKYGYIQDTIYQTDPNAVKKFKQGGLANLDGVFEGYLTECTLLYEYPNGFGYLTGVGLNNELA